MGIKLATHYKELAQQLNSMLPVDWSKIYYLGEVEKGRLSVSSTFYFIESDTKKISKSSELVAKFSVPRQEYKKTLRELHNILLKIYDCFKENEQELWEQLEFILDNDGKFKVDFKYDVMNDDNDQVLREIVWAYNTFEYVPDEGSYSREVLSEYLEKLN